MCPIYEKPTEGNKYFFWWNIPCFIPEEGKQACTQERLMCLVGPLQHQCWSQLIETFTILQVFLFNRDFLGKEKKKLQDPLITLQTINQSCAKYWYRKASSYGCRFHCRDAIKDQRGYAKTSFMEIAGGYGHSCSPAFPFEEVWSSPSPWQTPTASLWQERMNNHRFSWEPLLQLCHCPIYRLHYLQAAPSGLLCPRTTGGLAWEMPSSRRSSR